ncbi:unnamed protein product [Amoebophrya sp. A120]|nr:unnamed protein product [Amoebophrya sp. A120]|eukprot:GSA120T00018585001.1
MPRLLTVAEGLDPLNWDAGGPTDNVFGRRSRASTSFRHVEASFRLEPGRQDVDTATHSWALAREVDLLVSRIRRNLSKHQKLQVLEALHVWIPIGQQSIRDNINELKTILDQRFGLSVSDSQGGQKQIKMAGDDTIADPVTAADPAPQTPDNDDVLAIRLRAIQQSDVSAFRSLRVVIDHMEEKKAILTLQEELNQEVKACWAAKSSGGQSDADGEGAQGHMMRTETAANAEKLSTPQGETGCAPTMSDVIDEKWKFDMAASNIKETTATTATVGENSAEDLQKPEALQRLSLLLQTALEKHERRHLLEDDLAHGEGSKAGESKLQEEINDLRSALRTEFKECAESRRLLLEIAGNPGNDWSEIAGSVAASGKPEPQAEGLPGPEDHGQKERLEKLIDESDTKGCYGYKSTADVEGQHSNNILTSHLNIDENLIGKEDATGQDATISDPDPLDAAARLDVALTKVTQAKEKIALYVKYMAGSLEVRKKLKLPGAPDAVPNILQLFDDPLTNSSKERMRRVQAAMRLSPMVAPYPDICLPKHVAAPGSTKGSSKVEDVEEPMNLDSLYGRFLLRGDQALWQESPAIHDNTHHNVAGTCMCHALADVYASDRRVAKFLKDVIPDWDPENLQKALKVKNGESIRLPAAVREHYEQGPAPSSPDKSQPKFENPATHARYRFLHNFCAYVQIIKGADRILAGKSGESINFGDPKQLNELYENKDSRTDHIEYIRRHQEKIKGVFRDKKQLTGPLQKARYMSDTKRNASGPMNDNDTEPKGLSSELRQMKSVDASGEVQYLNGKDYIDLMEFLFGSGGKEGTAVLRKPAHGDMSSSFQTFFARKCNRGEGEIPTELCKASVQLAREARMARSRTPAAAQGLQGQQKEWINGVAKTQAARKMAIQFLLPKCVEEVEAGGSPKCPRAPLLLGGASYMFSDGSGDAATRDLRTGGHAASAECWKENDARNIVIRVKNNWNSASSSSTTGKGLVGERYDMDVEMQLRRDVAKEREEAAGSQNKRTGAEVIKKARLLRKFAQRTREKVARNFFSGLRRIGVLRGRTQTAPDPVAKTNEAESLNELGREPQRLELVNAFTGDYVALFDARMQEFL